MNHIKAVTLTGNKIEELTNEMCSKMTSLEDLVVNRNQLKVWYLSKQDVDVRIYAFAYEDVSNHA